jgi:hypothetical protein
MPPSEDGQERSTGERPVVRAAAEEQHRWQFHPEAAEHQDMRIPWKWRDVAFARNYPAQTLPTRPDLARSGLKHEWH